jgi:hypothetical protein
LAAAARHAGLPRVAPSCRVVGGTAGTWAVGGVGPQQCGSGGVEACEWLQGCGVWTATELEQEGQDLDALASCFDLPDKLGEVPQPLPLAPEQQLLFVSF